MAAKRGVMALTLAMPGWFFAIFLGLGLGTAIPAEVMFEQAWRLEMGGVEVQGQVTRLWQGTQSCGHDDMDTCATYNVAYGFDSGAWRTTETQVGQEFYGSLKEGGPIAVRYVASDPTIHEVEFGWTFFGGLLFLIFALVFGLTGGLGLRWRWRIARRMVTLRETGVVRQAQVTGREPTRIQVNNRTQWVMLWRDEAGAVGKSVAQRADGLPANGAAITIYADPAGKLAPVWTGDSGLW